VRRRLAKPVAAPDRALFAKRLARRANAMRVAWP